MVRPCTDSDIPIIEAIINDAAQRYHGAIPADCWHDPYMSRPELLAEIAAAVRFWGWQEPSGLLLGVMGMQQVGNVILIRHAYVSSGHQSRGIGTALLRALTAQAKEGELLVGTWAAAEWAIRFYQRHGFQLVPTEEKDGLLGTYWKISPRQRETSVVLRHAGPRRGE
jgi:GNAT superfamily N-acetyltransferase